MSDDPVLSLVEQQDWLQPIQDKGEQLVKEAYKSAGDAGQALKNAMHGVWLGHPLHSAVTDVPVGSWTAACILDLLEAGGRDEYAPGADAAVAVGLIGAAASAVSGLTDWSEIHGKPQRVGAMHGLLNVGAALLYGTSYALRKTGNRGLARALSFTGFGVVLASAYLGGALSYRQRIGVDHSADTEQDLPEEYTDVCNESELLEGKPRKATGQGADVVLVRSGEQVFALGEKCSHLGGPLSEGDVKDGSIVCPWHGSRFCLKTGSVLDGPATHPQPKLEVSIRNGRVLVRKDPSA